MNIAKIMLYQCILATPLLAVHPLTKLTSFVPTRAAVEQAISSSNLKALVNNRTFQLVAGGVTAAGLVTTLGITLYKNHQLKKQLEQFKKEQLQDQQGSKAITPQVTTLSATQGQVAESLSERVQELQAREDFQQNLFSQIAKVYKLSSQITESERTFQDDSDQDSDTDSDDTTRDSKLPFNTAIQELEQLKSNMHSTNTHQAIIQNVIATAQCAHQLKDAMAKNAEMVTKLQQAKDLSDQLRAQFATKLADLQMQQATTTAEKRELQKQLEELTATFAHEREELQTELSTLTHANQGLAQQLTNLHADYHQSYNELNQKYDAKKSEIAELTEQIEELTTNITKLQKDFSNRANLLTQALESVSSKDVKEVITETLELLEAPTDTIGNIKQNQLTQFIAKNKEYLKALSNAEIARNKAQSKTEDLQRTINAQAEEISNLESTIANLRQRILEKTSSRQSSVRISPISQESSGHSTSPRSVHSTDGGHLLSTPLEPAAAPTLNF